MNKTLQFLTQIVVLIPVAHIVVCSIFLTGYSLGFRDNITALVSVSDLFSISFGYVAQVYILGLFLPLSFITYNQTKPAKPVDLSLITLDQANAEVVKYTRRLRYFEYGSLLAGACAIGYTAWQIYHDRQVSYSILLFGLALVYMTQFWEGLEKRGLPNQTVTYVWCLLSFVISAFGTGWTSGEVDRRMKFAELRISRFGCNDVVVVRSLGENFLGVRRDNRRIVVDKECKVLFQFPIKPVFN